MGGWTIAWQFARRELRSGFRGFKILIACLALGVASVAGVGSVATALGENNDYSGDFSSSCGLIYGRDAAAVVQGIGPSIQTTGGDVQAMYQGSMIIGRLAMGADWLNPAAAIELEAA